MARIRWPAQQGSGTPRRGNFPNRALDHVKQLFSLLDFGEIRPSNSGAARFHYGKFIALLIPVMRRIDCCRAQDAWRSGPENRNLGFKSAEIEPLRICGIALLAATLTGCSAAVLDPHGPIGRQEKLILIDSTVIMLAIVIPVIIATLAFAWWYRAGNAKATRLPDWDYSGRIEFVVWAIPALVILFLGGIAWISSHDLDPPKSIASPQTPLDIDVVSLDWKWLFIYPDAGIASVNKLVLPVGTPVRFHMTSAGVMNSFFIPQLGSQVYTMAGMATKLNLMVDDPGVYRGISAQFSGEGFSDMTFEVSAVSRQDFEQWLDATRTGGGNLDAPAYETLTHPSAKDAQHTYGTVTGGIFEAILMHPGAAPSAAQIEHSDSAD